MKKKNPASKLIKKFLKDNPQVKKSLDLMNMSISEYEKAMDSVTREKTQISFHTTT